MAPPSANTAPAPEYSTPKQLLRDVTGIDSLQTLRRVTLDRGKYLAITISPCVFGELTGYYFANGVGAVWGAIAGMVVAVIVKIIVEAKDTSKEP